METARHIQSVRIKNFKCIKDETYIFTDFDLLVGRNNSGKSSVLQALGIWNYCIEEFRNSGRKGKEYAMQIVLPNFTPIPLPKFSLLWYKQTDRKNVRGENGKTKPELIVIDIEVTWRCGNEQKTFGVTLRYQGPQNIYAAPREGWNEFKNLDTLNAFPRILYIPPFSGLESKEEKRTVPVIKTQIGKFQPGSVIRNTLLRVFSHTADTSLEQTEDEKKQWNDLTTTVKDFFAVDLLEPRYREATDTNIVCEYKQTGDPKRYDIIAGGSGFHQTLILFSSIYAFSPDVVLFDEPDAHLHVNLLREVIAYLKKTVREHSLQCLIATHSEALIDALDAHQILSLLSQKPSRVNATAPVIAALAEVQNREIMHMKQSPYILYLEGDSDERLLRIWANSIGKEKKLNLFYIKKLHGGTKKEMFEKAEKHFNALRIIEPKVKRMMLFDRDEGDFHPQKDNAVLYEWERRHIENYLLVPDIWKKAARSLLQDFTLLYPSLDNIIDEFFKKEHITLNEGERWRTIDAELFKTLDGKKLLFEKEDSLFQQLRKIDKRLILNRETVASAMQEEEIHQNIFDFFSRLEHITK